LLAQTTETKSAQKEYRATGPAFQEANGGRQGEIMLQVCAAPATLTDPAAGFFDFSLSMMANGIKRSRLLAAGVMRRR
jgi:hypothetical protein